MATPETMRDRIQGADELGDKLVQPLRIQNPGAQGFPQKLGALFSMAPLWRMVKKPLTQELF